MKKTFWTFIVPWLVAWGGSVAIHEAGSTATFYGLCAFSGAACVGFAGAIWRARS